MTDTKKDLKEAFNINDDLEEPPSPPGGAQFKPKREATGEINSDDDSSDDSDNDPGVSLDKDANQPVKIFADPNKSTMAQVLSGKVPDTSNNTIVNKPQVNSRAPNVATQGEAEHTVYDNDTVDDDKPWLRPGADITDYFNYGFDEETWKIYCEKQRMIRAGLDPKTARGLLPRKDDRDRGRDHRDHRRDRRDRDHDEPRSIRTTDDSRRDRSHTHQNSAPSMEDIQKQAARAAEMAAAAMAAGHMPPGLPSLPGLPMPGALAGLPNPANLSQPLPIPGGAKVKSESRERRRSRSPSRRDRDRRHDDRDRKRRYDDREYDRYSKR